MTRLPVVHFLVSLSCAVLLGTSACGRRTFDPAEVRRFAVDYLAAVDRGEVDRQMTMVARDSSVTSVVMGYVWTGWDSIRAQSERFAPYSGKLRIAVDDVRVVPLGSDAAIAVVRFTQITEQPIPGLPPHLENALTLVLRRGPGGWRMMHEHVSVKLPPPDATGS